VLYKCFYLLPLLTTEHSVSEYGVTQTAKIRRIGERKFLCRSTFQIV